MGYLDWLMFAIVGIGLVVIVLLIVIIAQLMRVTGKK
jgi:hypothetical protein